MESEIQEENNLHEDTQLISDKLNSEIFALKEVITMIVDYYCFKNNMIEDKDGDADNWKVNTKYEQKSNIIPENINKLIEQTFKAQLKKFID